MPSLHQNGWRQGSVFDAELTAVSYAYVDGHPTQVEEVHKRWVVISQDCDLAAADSDDNTLLIEALPVLEGSGGGGWGIRSRIIRLRSDLHTDGRLPKLRISPAALSVYLMSAVELEPGRTTALKTWLGLRYDRPAVPEVLVDLAKAIAKAVKGTRTPELSAVTHDVLFAASEERPATFQLLAVINDPTHRDAVRTWLAEAALEVDPALGALASPPEALTKDQVTLGDLENSYSADLSDISWSKNEPKGAV